MAVPPLSKQDLRQILKKQRDGTVSSIGAEEQFRAASSCAAYALTARHDAKSVATYLPIGSEMDTAPIIAELQKTGTQIALPHVISRSSPLRFLAWAPGTQLAAGPFGLRQPREDAQELTPDVILTPLLGFDRSGNRIGYGAGHYDRAFAAHPNARRIGIAWSFQEIEHVPADAWDIPLHAVATERELITV